MQTAQAQTRPQTRSRRNRPRRLPCPCRHLHQEQHGLRNAHLSGRLGLQEPVWARCLRGARWRRHGTGRNLLRARRAARSSRCRAPPTSAQSPASPSSSAKATRDPVAPAKRSASASAKAASKLLDDTEPVHSFATLMAEMATLVRNTCRTPSAGADAPTFELLTSATAHQQRALALIQAIQP